MNVGEMSNMIHTSLYTPNIQKKRAETLYHKPLYTHAAIIIMAAVCYFPSINCSKTASVTHTNCSEIACVNLSPIRPPHTESVISFQLSQYSQQLYVL